MTSHLMGEMLKEEKQMPTDVKLVGVGGPAAEKTNESSGTPVAARAVVPPACME